MIRARAAQAQVADYSQEQIDDICRSVAWQTYCDENIKVCAETAVEETGMGNVADKISKHKVIILHFSNRLKKVMDGSLVKPDEDSLWWLFLLLLFGLMSFISFRCSLFLAWRWR